MMTGKHVVFYDGACGLCDFIVQRLIKADKKEIFLFAPLQGKTAAAKLKLLPQSVTSKDSLILVENFNQPNESVLIYGKAALRILWLLGGIFSLPGMLSFLPGFLFDWAYRLVAKNRARFVKSDRCFIPENNQKGRYLP